jgi:hypothetical protein
MWPECANTPHDKVLCTTNVPTSGAGCLSLGVAQTGRAAEWTGGAAVEGSFSIQIFMCGEMPREEESGHRVPICPF